MTLSTVAVDDPVLASREQQIIAHVNASPGRQIFTSNGTFSVPNGVHKFRVFLAAGGAGGRSYTTGGGGEDSYIIPGAAGNSAHMASCDFSGVDIGTSFAVTIGAGGAGPDGTGGSTSFGSTFSATGASTGGKGTVTFPSGDVRASYHGNGMYANSAGRGYGQGGDGYDGVSSGSGGTQGVVVVEW
jgi:hypothetical protein